MAEKAKIYGEMLRMKGERQRQQDFFLPCPKCLIAQKVEGSGSRLRFAPASILLNVDEIERLIEKFKWKVRQHSIEVALALPTGSSGTLTDDKT